MLGRGSWWVIALAGFLVRGGLLLLIPPIVMIPTTAELGGLLDPSIVGTGLATPTPALVALVAGLAITFVVALVVTTVIGEWLELSLVDAAAADDELAAFAATPTDAPPPRAGLVPASIVRLVAHLPTLAAGLVAVFAIGVALTNEVTSPSGPGPLPLRVLLDVPIPVAALVILWLVGEAWGGIAVRRLRIGAEIGRALGLAWLDLLHPSGLATLVVGSLVVALPVAILWYAAGRAFDRLWPLVVDGADAQLVAIALVLLVATWIVGLWLLAIGLAWRSAAWTAEVLRRT
jgi:hypothetical protein